MTDTKFPAFVGGVIEQACKFDISLMLQFHLTIINEAWSRSQRNLKYTERVCEQFSKKLGAVKKLSAMLHQRLCISEGVKFIV